MALGLLPLLLAGGGIKRGFDRHFEQQDRTALSQGVSDLFAPQGQGFSAPTFGADGSIGVNPAQTPGLFGGVSGADFRSNAAALFALPGGSQFGQSLIQQSLGFEQSNQQQLAGFTQRDLEQQTGFAEQRAQQQIGFTQRDLEQENQQEFTENQNNLNRSGVNERSRLDRESREEIAANTLAQKGISDGFGDATPNSQGFVPFKREDGSLGVRAVPGSTAYIAAQEELQNSELAMEEIDAIITSIEESGFGEQQFGEEAGRQGIRYRNVVAHIAALQNLGVLQEAEAERLEASIADPSSVTGATTSDDRMVAAYQELQRLFQRKLKNADAKYSDWGLGSGLTKSTPAQIREMEEKALRDSQAAALGLTPDAVARQRQSSESSDRIGDGIRRGLRGAIPGGGLFNIGSDIVKVFNSNNSEDLGEAERERRRLMADLRRRAG